MTSIAKHIFLRDCYLYWCNGALLRTASFYLLCVSLFSFGVGFKSDILSSMAYGITWISMLFACLLSFDQIFQEDFEDGTLDQYIINCHIMDIVLAKLLSYWCSVVLPVVFVAPLSVILLGMTSNAALWLCISLGMGSIIFTCLGAIGASLTISVKRGGLVIPFLVVPLCIPAILLGTQLENNLLPYMMLLGAVMLFSFLIAIVSIPLIVKVHYA